MHRQGVEHEGAVWMGGQPGLHFGGPVSADLSFKSWRCETPGFIEQENQLMRGLLDKVKAAVRGDTSGLFLPENLGSYFRLQRCRLLESGHRSGQ